MAINFFSEEWAAIRAKIEDDVKANLGALERAQTLEQMCKAQGALQALRSLLNLPNKKQ